jgi:hypothetical protein
LILEPIFGFHLSWTKDGKSPIQGTIRLEVARLHASHYLSLKIREYSQWFRGADNQVPDALSRDNDRTDEKLTKILRLHCPSQVPPHFKIAPLPSKIVSWLTLLLLWLPPKLELAEEHMRTMLGRGPATPNTATALASTGTISSMECPDSTELQSWGLLLWLYVKGDFQHRVMVPWLKSQSKVPSTQWLQPSEKMDKKTPPIGTQSATLGDFYSGN